MFGSGAFVALYSDFKSDSSVTWSLNPAVRHPTGSCIEEANCDWEKVTLCAFNVSTTTDDRVMFLACMDEKEGTYESATKLCATRTGLDDAKIMECYNSAQGTELLEAASDVWNKAFPERYTVPHTFVNKTDVQPDFLALRAALCKAGSTAKVCSGLALDPPMH